MTVHGPSFFESGPVTRCNSFFHTFDLPGSYWVTSHGTDGQTCRIEVLNEGRIVNVKINVNLDNAHSI